MVGLQTTSWRSCREFPITPTPYLVRQPETSGEDHWSKISFYLQSFAEHRLNEVVPQPGIGEDLSWRNSWQLVFHAMQRRGGRGPGQVDV